MIARLQKKTWRKVLFGWIVSAVLFLSSVFVAMPQTARGVQCPTAPVQLVTETIYVRNCCGKLVPKVTTRAPREGEAQFKQCQCAEKKAAETQDQKSSAETGGKGVGQAILNAPLFAMTGMLFAVVSVRPGFLVGRPASLSSAPPTPPPQLI